MLVILFIIVIFGVLCAYKLFKQHIKTNKKAIKRKMKKLAQKGMSSIHEAFNNASVPI